RESLFRLPRPRRRDPRHRGFGVDGERGRLDRQAGAGHRARRRLAQIPRLPPRAARGRHHPLLRRRARGLALRGARRHGARRRRDPPPQRARRAGADDGMRRVLAFCLLGGLVMLVLTAVPEIDLQVSGLFYREDGGFVLGAAPLVRLLYRSAPYLTAAILLFSLGCFAAYLLGRPGLLGCTPRAARHL